MKRLTRNLLNASVDAFILGLETINRPSVEYRTQGAAILFCNAWELLLKARLLDTGAKIFRKKERNRLRETISIDQCLGRIFTDVNDPIRMNIKTMADFRDQSVHFVVPFISPELTGLFQSSALNFNRMLGSWFSVSLSQKMPLGMLAIVYDFDPA